jgi:hypothetical protein
MTANKFCAAFVAFFLAGIASISTCVADDFQGTWKVKDSSGRPFDITLLADGKATSTMHPDQTGSWKEQDSTVVITWSTGWSSKIESSDGHYRHTAYRPGQSLQGSPNNMSDAEKVR